VGLLCILNAFEDSVMCYLLRLVDTIAVGDVANYLDIIRRAGLGVAYHAKPIVAAAAATSISHGDLTSLLYLQGYRAAEIVSP
jgi:phosphoserine phosphatase